MGRFCNIQSIDAEQITLYPSKTINTDFDISNRVENGIRKKTSNDIYSLIELGYYTCHQQKEHLILDFTRLAMKYGKKTIDMLTNDTVNELQNAVKALTRESHQLKGFVRFSIYNGVLASVIEPKNYVLPVIAPHFCDRFANETFIIYDLAHRSALIYRPNEYKIFSADEYIQPNADEEEIKYRSLWKLFYDTIAIEERYNPKCRMSHMQKRYWKHLTEMNDVYSSLALNKNNKDEILRIE